MNSKFALRGTTHDLNLPNRYKSKLLLIVASTLVIPMLLIGSGCGGSKEWPSSEGDYSQVKAGRGLAMMWGVIIDIEKADGNQINISQSGNVGETPDATFAEKELQLGDVTIRLSAEGSKQLKLTVNGKDYGTVRVQNRVKVTEEREVLVNGTKREGK